MAIDERYRADGVFEGSGVVRTIAFAGAVASAERDGNVREWVNLAGSSAGAIVAALLAVGYDAAGVARVLAHAPFARFADFGTGGRWVGGLVNTLRGRRGLAAGKFFAEWMREQLASSPLARELGKAELTFGDLKRRDLPPMSDLPDMTPEQYERVTYRLHVVGSDVTAGRMLLMPGDLPNYADRNGKVFDKDSFSVVDALRMSTSYPVLFAPIVLYNDLRPHYIVDGGLLSTFPVALFDTGAPKRPTWGFRLFAGASEREGMTYRKIPRFLWERPLLKAAVRAGIEGWGGEYLDGAIADRTVDIPTHDVAATDFKLPASKADDLYRWGQDAGASFFHPATSRNYLNEFGRHVVHGAALPGEPLELPSRRGDR